MTNYIASEVIGERLTEIIAAMKSNNGTHAIYVSWLEKLVSDLDQDNFNSWQQITEVVRYTNAPD